MCSKVRNVLGQFAIDDNETKDKTETTLQVAKQQSLSIGMTLVRTWCNTCRIEHKV